jgi:tRNA (guanosine-2'-O-)-methyltransferase
MIMSNCIMNLETKKALAEYLPGFMTPERNSLFDRVIANRTRYITVVLEDIYQSHNASAVLRTCDCFGIQDVHIIENRYEYNLNPEVTMGSSNWLSVQRYNSSQNNTSGCLGDLKKAGYRIVATTPHTNDTTLTEFDVTKGKFALIFGTEKEGLSELALSMADEFVKIPMYGFTESFNISVSAALSLFHLSEKMRQSDIQWHLTEDEMLEVKLNWMRYSIRNSALIEKNFLEKTEKSSKRTVK